MEECFLTSEKIKDKRKLCELACQLRGRPETCSSTSAMVAAILGIAQDPNDILDEITPEMAVAFTKAAFQNNFTSPLRTIHLMPGSACDNYQGYCDVFQKCRQVDEEGPLLRIKNMFFGKETLKSIQSWITERWWAVVLIGIGFIVAMGGLIKLCAVHTPSSNPKRPPARRLQDTFYYVPMTTARRVGSAATSTIRRMRHHHPHLHHHQHPAAAVQMAVVAPSRRTGPIADVEAEISLAPAIPPGIGPRPGGRAQRQNRNGAVAIGGQQLPKAGKRSGSRPNSRDFSPIQNGQKKPKRGRKP
jgi:hypothetical protein